MTKLVVTLQSTDEECRRLVTDIGRLLQTHNIAVGDFDGIVLATWFHRNFRPWLVAKVEPWREPRDGGLFAVYPGWSRDLWCNDSHLIVAVSFQRVADAVHFKLRFADWVTANISDQKKNP